MLLEDLTPSLRKTALALQAQVLDMCDRLDIELEMRDSLEGFNFWDPRVVDKLTLPVALLKVSMPGDDYKAFNFMLGKSSVDDRLMSAYQTDEEDFENFRIYLPGPSANAILKHFIVWPIDENASRHGGSVYKHDDAEHAHNDDKLVMHKGELWSIEKLPLKELKPDQEVLVVGNSPNTLAAAFKVMGVESKDTGKGTALGVQHFLDEHPLLFWLAEKALTLNLLDEHVGEVLKFKLTRFGLEQAGRLAGASNKRTAQLYLLEKAK